MINKRDVIRLRMPFPDIASALALHAHMYVCMDNSGIIRKFVKCQTLKPNMLIHSIIKHYVDENPDILRNPFVKSTRIDCDKQFITENIKYMPALRTKIRPDICEDTMTKICAELSADGYTKHHLNKADILSLNEKTEEINAQQPHLHRQTDTI